MDQTFNQDKTPPQQIPGPVDDRVPQTPLGLDKGLRIVSAITQRVIAGEFGDIVRDLVKPNCDGVLRGIGNPCERHVGRVDFLLLCSPLGRNGSSERLIGQKQRGLARCFHRTSVQMDDEPATGSDTGRFLIEALG